MTAQHIKLEDIIVASHVLKDVVQHTPLQKKFHPVREIRL